MGKVIEKGVSSFIGKREDRGKCAPDVSVISLPVDPTA